MYLLFFIPSICNSWKGSKLKLLCYFYHLLSLSGLLYGMTSSSHAAWLPSAVSSWLTRKKTHYSPTLSLSHSLAEWNTTSSTGIQYAHRNRYTRTHVLTHTQNYNLIQNRGKEGIYVENDWCSMKTEKGLFFCRLSSSAHSLFMSLSSWIQ